MPRGFTESIVEDAALAWIEGLGWTVKHGPGIAPDTPGGNGGIMRRLALSGACVVRWGYSTEAGK